MKYLNFGRTGLSVSNLCLGTATFGKQTSEVVSHQILDRASEAGINLLDLADFYPMGATLDEVGRTEEISGRWLKGKRGRFILATKGGGPVGPSSWDQGSSRKHLLDAIEASLRRLGTDYVDLYQLHFDDPKTPIDEVAEAMDAIVRAGKARYIGVSNFLAYRLARAIGLQNTMRLTRFVSVQPRYNLLFREIERETLPLAQEEGLAVIPFNPLAGGLLTGKYKHDVNPEAGRFSAENGRFGAIYQQRYWHQREFETIGRLSELANREGKPLATLAVEWILANPAVTSVILGASRLEQLTDTLASADGNMRPELKAELDDLTVEYRRGDAGG